MKKNTKYLLESREVESIFDAITDNVALISPDFSILKVNQTTSDYFKIPKEELIGKKCFACFQNLTSVCPDCPVEISIKTKKKYLKEAYAEPTDTWLEIATYPLIDKQGDLIGVIEHAKDITSRKKSEDQLIQSQKTEAIRILSGGLVHDFNNLLNKIQFQIGVIENNIPAESEVLNNIDAVKKSIKAGAGIAKQLISMSKGTVSPFQAIDVNSLISDIINLTKLSTRKNVKLLFDSKSSLANVLGDYSQLHQVFLNLTINAIDAIASEGVISFATGISGDVLEISVTDSGVGIPENIIHKVFDPFFSTKKKGENFGLGLTSVKNIIEKHKGKIEVTSSQGEGTSFKIKIPLYFTPVASIVDKSEEIKKEDMKNCNVLFVDDDLLILELYKIYFKTKGFVVYQASSGSEALNVFQKNKHDIHMIVSDFLMPDMNGIELTKHIKKINPAMPVILSTGYINMDCTTLSPGFIPDGYIQKPIDPDKLIEKIFSLCGQKNY